MGLKKRLLILDRDGVINQDNPRYVRSVTDFKPIEGSIESISLLSKAGYLVAIVTNQAGISKGLYTHQMLEKIHHELKRQVSSFGGRVDCVEYCPHQDFELCLCRKPKTLMIQKVEKFLDIEAKGAPLLGDKPSDVALALNSGAQPVLIDNPLYPQAFEDSIKLCVAHGKSLKRFSSFKESVPWLLSLNS